MDRQGYWLTTRTDANGPYRGSPSYTSKCSPDPRQPLLPLLSANAGVSANVSDGINHTIISRRGSINDGGLNSARHEARTTITGAELWNNIEGNEGESQTEADSRQSPPKPSCMVYNCNFVARSFGFVDQGWPRQSEDHPSHTFAGHRATTSLPTQPVTDDPSEFFGPKNTLDATLPWCDRSYATAGAFNEDIGHSNSVPSAAQENGFPNESWLRSRVYKIPHLRARQEGASLNGSEATVYLSLMDDVEKFSTEVDETEDVVVNAQRRRRAPQNPISNPIFSFREDCSAIFATNVSKSRISQCRQYFGLPTSSRKMAELHISDEPLTSDGPMLAPTGACLRQFDTQTSTSPTTPSTRRPVSENMTCPDCPDHPGFTGELKARKNSLRRHKREKHSEQARERFVCVTCSHSTIRRGRRRHLENEHHMALPPNTQRRKPWGELKDTLDMFFVRVFLPETSGAHADA